MLSHRMAIINLAANIDTRVQKMYEVRAAAAAAAAAGEGALPLCCTVGVQEPAQAAAACAVRWPGQLFCLRALGCRRTAPIHWAGLPMPPALPSCHPPPQVIECDIAPQVASRGVGIAPYKASGEAAGEGCGELQADGEGDFASGSTRCFSASPALRLTACHLACPSSAPQGKHATGSGGEAAAEVYRQAQAGGSGGAGPSNSHMPSSGAPSAAAYRWLEGLGRRSGLIFR